jgi:hypothetical protein
MTFLSDIFFSGDKKISRNDFNKALRSLSSISDKERKYLNEVFKSDLSDGLSAYELKSRLEKLRHNTNDPIDSGEVEQIKRKLLGELEK